MNTASFRMMMTRMRAIIVVLLCMVPIAVSAQTTVKYVHTDALGSVVAMTDASGNPVEGRREYEPYGYQTTPVIQDGPGYTGHVQDAATGLTYMQQRYYDPQLGVFLSVDPVTAYSNPIGQFHRYRYANNNPYSFTDPDGRAAICLIPGPMQICMLAAAAVGKIVVDAVVISGAVIAIAAPVILNSESESENESPSPESEGESGSSDKSGSGTRTPAPFLPEDPYSPEETSRRQSGNREAEGAPSRDPDSPIPDRNPGSDQGGHASRGRTPHSTGERNVNSNEEHSRRPKGNPSGRER